MNRWIYLLILTAAVAGGAAAALGDHDSHVDLSAALAVWGNVARDVDQAALRFTRVSTAEEMAIGDRLAGTTGASGGSDDGSAAYVNDVGQSLTPFVRRRDI